MSKIDLTAPREGNTFALRGLISGPQDVLAARSTSVNGVLALTRVILRRAPELKIFLTNVGVQLGSESFRKVDGTNELDHVGEIFEAMGRGHT